jgi:hypothetical protein
MRTFLFAPLALLSVGCAMRVEPLGPAGAGDEQPRPQRVVHDPAEGPDDPADPTSRPDDPSQPGTSTPSWDASRVFRNAVGGRIKGTIGAVRNADLPSDLAFIYDDGWFTQIEVYARRSDGQRVMIQLQADNTGRSPFFVPGVGLRFVPGYVAGRFLGALACQGPDSGRPQMGMAFADTPYDEEPCDVSIDTEENPDEPGTLDVRVLATLPDQNGDCPSGPSDPDGDGGEDLPDLDGDGDGDLPPDAEAGGNAAYPLATSTFRLVQ